MTIVAGALGTRVWHAIGAKPFVWLMLYDAEQAPAPSVEAALREVVIAASAIPIAAKQVCTVSPTDVQCIEPPPGLGFLGLGISRVFARIGTFCWLFRRRLVVFLDVFVGLVGGAVLAAFFAGCLSAVAVFIGIGAIFIGIGAIFIGRGGFLLQPTSRQSAEGEKGQELPSPRLRGRPPSPRA